MRLWRIAAETRKYAADDLSGAGAAISPGRWNEENEAVVYCAPTIAMAVLETAAHINDAGLPLNRFIVAIDVPDAIWARRQTLDRASLPATWGAIPAGRASVAIGSAWLAAKRSTILIAPSVVVPEEDIALINPALVDAAGIRAHVVRQFEFSGLFR